MVILPDSDKKQTRRSETMDEFFVKCERYREALVVVLHSSLAWVPIAFVSALAFAFGYGAMSEGKYILALGLYGLAVAIIASKAIYDWRSHERRREIRVIVIAGSVLCLAGLVGWIGWNIYYKLSPDLHGVLIAGTDPTPALPENCRIPAGARMLFMGSSVGFISSEKGETVAIKCEDDTLLSMSNASGGVYISGRVYSSKNKLVAQLTDNELFLNPGNVFQRTRNDWSDLIIMDDQGEKVLHVSFANKDAIKVLGTFYSPPCGVIVINEDGMQFGNSVAHNCYGDLGTMLQFTAIGGVNVGP